jgi:hypothetical protein
VRRLTTMAKSRLIVGVLAASLLLAALGYSQETAAQLTAEESTGPAAVSVPAAQSTAPAAEPAAPAAQAPAPTRLFPGAKVFIEEQTEFGMALAASFIEKKVPLTVVADPEKADFTIRSVSQDRKASTAAKIFAVGRDRYHATVSIYNRDAILVFAYNVKKNTFQDAANSTANEIKKKGITYP